MSSLVHQMKAALKSREDRVIRRSLPNPAESQLVDFTSNDYLSLTKHEPLRSLFLSKLQLAPDILGSGGSRLLVNGRAHDHLEKRLAQFFDSPAALLYNSGLDANTGFFSCVPQPGDFVVSDEYVHASVHDGVRASRVRGCHRTFGHNSVVALRQVLKHIISENKGVDVGRYSVFVAVESLYSMDGTFSPLKEIVELVEELFSNGNGYVVVDEAHATGIYGPQGRGIVTMLGLENRVLARLHTFGKALGSSGAVLVTSTLIRDYMINYARSFIYTTSISYANIIAVDCAFDLLEQGALEPLSTKVLELSTHFVDSLRRKIATIPPSIISFLPHLHRTSTPHSTQIPFPSPIVAILTAYPRPLSAFLYSKGMNARPITWPTVPKGKDRVRICLHAGNSRSEVDRLIEAILEWAQGIVEKRKGEARMREKNEAGGRVVRILMESKL